jgi:Mn2+/Fe2+ NRAMP family transporter
MAFFTSPVAATAGWIHYLVFDLFVGAWQVRDAQRRGITHLAVIPCLVLTLLAGPVGLLLYLALRTGMRRGGFLLEDAV